MSTATLRSEDGYAMLSVDGFDRFKINAAAVADLNTEDLPTFCTASNTTLNTPVAGLWYSVVCGTGVQTATQIWNANAPTYVRIKNFDGINWEPWRELASEYARPTTNFNTIKGNGVFSGNDGITGAPPATAFLGWYIYQRDVGALWLNQRAVAIAAEALSYTRNSIDGGATWGAWVATDGVGAGQTWQDVSGSRVSGTTYTNSTGKAIEVAVASVNGSASSANVAGVTRVFSGGSAGTTAHQNCSFTVPAGATYSVTFGGARIYWHELR
jgi:hypothetical protein